MPADSQYDQAEQASATAPPAAASDPPRDPTRDDDGRFPKGVSGNPAGRPKGARNNATRFAQLVMEYYADQLAAEAVMKALKGDGVSLRFCLSRLIAPRRAAAVPFELPKIDNAADLVGAVSAVTQAAAQGTLTPGEAGELARVLETALRLIEARKEAVPPP
jgi:hypothetical protein